MGTNAAPEIANYYLLHLLDPEIIYNSKVKLYKRYLDDLLIFWNGTRDEFQTFYAHLNQLIAGITFTHHINPNPPHKERPIYANLDIKRATSKTFNKVKSV